MDKEPIGSFVDDTDGDSNKLIGGDGGDGSANERDAGDSGSAPESIAGYDTIDPRSVAGGGSSGTGKRRGRKPGSRNKTQGEKTPIDITGLESILLSIHTMGAAILATPSLVIDDKEAKLLADATKKVAAFYPTNINPKTLAWANLIIVAGGIYGSRVVAYMLSKKDERKPAAGPVVVSIDDAAKRTARESNAAESAQPMTPSQLYSQPFYPEPLEGTV